MASRDVTPDDSLLEQIFTSSEPRKISIILHNWDKCVFKVEFLDAPEHHRPVCVVRLESENESAETFTIVAALQQIAATSFQNLSHRLFKVAEQQMRKEERNTLETVWDRMNAEDQRAVVIELVEALNKLHCVRLSDGKVREILGKVCYAEISRALMSFDQTTLFGGPHTGFLNDGIDLLNSIAERRKLNTPFCSIQPTANTQGINVQSVFEDLGSIFVDNSDINKWPGEAVLCHNDLTPRNIILQTYISFDGKLKYKLVGIIDWELAGFYPASYELSLQDTYLSGGNRRISFYLLLKDHMKRAVPRTSSQVALLQAMELIFESQQTPLLNGNNTPDHIRKRFMEYLQLVRDEDPYVGWIRKSQGEPFPDYSSAAIQKLEDDVVDEIVAKRNLRARQSLGINT
ncbi:hypothetical protein F5884DRAFT_880897 [Xylogone sp. PMI_703]|nr:hypothetical protein F5884DRAFT_880897 [Xylogone sp. PMI_703]